MAIFDLTTEHGKMDYFSLYKIKLPENAEHHFQWFSHKDDKIAVQYYIPDSPKGSVFLVHGYYDHVGIYWPIIDFLLSKQIAVFSYDNIGHGLSTGKRAHIDSFDQYQDLLNELLIEFNESDKFPKPYTLIGQSMGGAICLEYFKRQESFGIFDKSILFAPLVRPYQWNKSKWKFFIVKYLMPWKKYVPRKYSLRSHNKAFQDFSLIDPLQPKVLPVAWVNAMRMWFSVFIRKPYKINNSANSLTVYLASRDETIDAGFSKRVILESFCHTDFIEVPNTFHHLIQEPAFIEALSCF